MREALGQQRGVDAFLDVTHQQEPSRADLAEHDHGHVVDAGAAIRRDRRDLAADGPQDAQRDLVDGEAVAGGQPQPDRCTRIGQLAQPGGIAGTRPAHAGFEDATDPVALQQQRQAGHVILVRVGQDERIDAPVPGSDALVECDQEAVRVGAAVDQKSAAA